MSSSPLQNRIVGTLVVVGLAVIILPELFSNAGRPQSDDFQVTPLRPSASAELQSPTFPEDFQAAETYSNSVVAVPIFDEIEDRELAQPLEVGVEDSNNEWVAEVDANRISDAYVIQLGAFGNPETVERLLRQLREAGYSAYSRVLRRSSGELQLVLVGPDLDENKLTTQLEPLQSLTGLEGKVVPYRPADE